MLTQVLVVAGSPAARRGLSSLLSTSDDFATAAAVGWDGLKQSDAELILGELVGGDPVPDFLLPVLLLTDRRDFQLEAGPGKGQLSRQADDSIVLAALRAVREGLWVTDRPRDPAPGRGPDALTPRELEVLEMLVEGLGNRQLAAALGISENTVKFHLASVFSKLDVSSRTEAVTAGIRAGYLLV